MVVKADVQSDGKGYRCRKLCSEHRVIVLSICLIVIGVIVGILLILAIPALLKKVERPYRLPTDILPHQYELEIKPHLTPGDFKFEGKVAIHVTCTKKTDLIILHARNLTIKEKSVRVTSIDDGENYEVLLIDYDNANDLLILRLLEELKEWTRYRIYIDYTGILREHGSGFYVSSYEDDQNITHFVASTQFEPVGARRAFPCFDEPQLKSTFNITLLRWGNMTTLSNMPKLRTENRGRYWKADIYKESMKMSTYLVAFVFCDYVGNTKGKVTVWSPEHRRNNTDYALDIAIKTIDFLERKLDMLYPGPKLDMVPVPYLQSSAMENWGLIIYSEETLFTPEERNEEYGIAIATITSVVSHEIAHHWFGNLVTLKWWTDLWLNEGITSYMDNLIEAFILPDWNQVDPTVREVFNLFPYYCTYDEPLRRPVHNSEEADEMFDIVTYSKGAMVTRMAHHILGEEVFWRGIRRYLNAFSYENVEETDFWKHLTAAQLHRPIKERVDMEEMMRPWTHLSSVPIVTVHRDYTRRNVRISQQPCSQDKEHENDTWNIPLVFGWKYSSNLFGKVTWLTTRNTTVEDMPEEKYWIVINTNAIGFYLVNYDRKNWELINKQLLLSHTTFQPTERYRIVTDIVNLDRLVYIDIDVVFQCFLYTHKENEVVILQQQMIYLLNYLNYFEEEKYHKLMEEFAVHLWRRIYDKYGWAGIRNSTKMLSEDEMLIGYIVTTLLCHLGYGPCVQEALNRHELIRSPEEKMRVRDYNWIISCVLSGNATLEEWDSIKDQYSEEAPSNVSLALCTKDASIIQQELHNSYAGYEEFLFIFFVGKATGEKIGFDEYLNFVDEHFDKIPATMLELSEHIQDILKQFGNVSRMRRIIYLLEKHRRNASGAKAESIGKLLEFFKENMPLWEKKARELKRWLERKSWRSGSK